MSTAFGASVCCQSRTEPFGFCGGLPFRIRGWIERNNDDETVVSFKRTEARKFSHDDRLRSGTPGPEAARPKTPVLSPSWALISFVVVVPMVIGTITAQSASNGVTMRETVAQKRKGVIRLKEPEVTPAPKLHSASPKRASLSARYPVNGAWPAEMRIDMLAAYLDFRNVRELVLAVSRGEPPTQ